MSFLLVNQGEDIWADAVADEMGALRLFQNNWTPADGDDEGDVTEANFSGYSAKTLTPGSWVITPGAPTTMAYPEQTFTADDDVDPAQTVYGAYITQVTTGKLMCAWRFDDGPYTVSLNGDQIKHTPNISIKKPSEA
jgi:hypothetical protein